MAERPVWLTEDLVLGWKVSKALEPQHWDKADPRPGEHKVTDVVTTAPKTIAHHTVIIAQSGSGKSFFLGRLIEEIVLKTRSRVLVLDQNSDFRKIAQAKPANHWTDTAYRYDRSARKGFLADEPSQADFTSRWEKISTLLYSRKPESADGFELLRLDWLKFPVDLLAEDAPEEHRDQLRHCHSFVNILAELAVATANERWLKEGAFLRCAQELCESTSQGEEEKVVVDLRNTFGAAGHGSDYGLNDPNVITDRRGDAYVQVPRHLPTLAGIFAKKECVAYEDLELIYQRAAKYRRFVLPDALRFYFSRAVELERAELIDPNVPKALRAPVHKRIEVVDLPSIPDGRHQKMAICTFLEAEWQRARLDWEEALGKEKAEDDTRVPTFIVIEEAHNAAPSSAETPTERKLQEQFRRIAAEGRKYGLFLILVSQRPDKLDRMVMSECENRAVMRVGSSFILKTTCEILGLDGVMPRMTEKVLDFDLGRALLAGPWVSDEPTFLVSAARRTEEGGRDLQWKYWAQPETSGGSTTP